MYDDLFRSVKESVTAREAAERYGIKVKRNGMARCPFHDDRMPSLKLDRRYHCFGCLADGDVIDLTAGLFGLPVRDAALKLAEDFNVSYRSSENEKQIFEEKSEQEDPKEKSEKEDPRVMRVFLDDVWDCFIICSDYRDLLREWRTEYAPSDEEEEWHPLFKEALQEEKHMEYILDTLMNGSEEDVTAAVNDVKGSIPGLKKRISECRGEATESE